MHKQQLNALRPTPTLSNGIVVPRARVGEVESPKAMANLRVGEPTLLHPKPIRVEDRGNRRAMVTRQKPLNNSLQAKQKALSLVSYAMGHTGYLNVHKSVP